MVRQCALPVIGVLLLWTSGADGEEKRNDQPVPSAVQEAGRMSAATGPDAKTGDMPLRIWAFSDAHVGTDLKRKRESLADAIRQSENDGATGTAGFDWDIAVDAGDMSGGQDTPKDPEGEEVVRQFGVLKKHRREAVYSVCGNHDRSGLSEPPAWWWRKWVDPTGEHPEHSKVDRSRRPYPVEGTWERYSFRVGNLLFLMMSDINEPTQKVGRGDLGGNPGGVVSGETFEWWKRMVEANPESIIISVHHYVLKNTTVASGEWEGMRKDENGKWRGHYHGHKEKGTPSGASYLCWVGSQFDAQAFEKYLEAHPGAIHLWMGGHTHTVPDDNYGGKSLLERKWGVDFLNVSALTQYHNGRQTSAPMSRLLTFQPGSDEVRVQCWLHTAAYAPLGWYGKAEKVLRLGRAFQWKTPDARK